MTTKKTQNEKIITRLTAGKNLTVAEARSRLGVQNLAARIHELREEGFVIHTNKTTFRGRSITAYTMSR
jgi:predicted ArsR family transcriptional regulator